MEEIINGEQPKEELVNVQNCDVENNEIDEDNKEGTALNNSTDGSLGKFKDAETLLSAYNNLQAEFTKKCQKLSEVSKQLESNSLNNSLKEDAKPVFQMENWKECVSSFLEQNSGAKKYSGEIANEILTNKELQNSPNALELAWAKVMQKNYAEPELLAKDQNFINEKILSQDQVKQQVINEYFKNLNKNYTPTVISSGSGNVATLATPAPKNLSEAKKMVEKMLNVH